MTVNCYYVGFGAVHSIEFLNKDDTIYRSGTVDQRLSSNVTNAYTYENVAFYFIAKYLKTFFKKYPNTKKITVFTSIDNKTINKMIDNPSTDAEKELSSMYKNKSIVFDCRGDARLMPAAKNVAYTYFNLKKNNNEIKFNGNNADPFVDVFGDRYNIYN